MSSLTSQVLNLIHDERLEQNAKWGYQKHGPHRWLAILAEEFGEVAKNVVECEYPVCELVQLAAVAVAWIEYAQSANGSAMYDTSHAK